MRLSIDYIKQMAPWTPEAVLNELERLAAGARCIVELGAWLGRTTIPLARATSGIVFSVDDWKGGRGIGEVENPQELFGLFLDNLEEAGVMDKVSPIKGDIDEVVKIWPLYCTAPIDLLFIDADHSYRAVLHELTTWVPYVSPTGVICGDDYGEVHEAVDHYFAINKTWVLISHSTDRLWVAKHV